MDKMATFSRRLFETLNDLDMHSQLIVIANNIRGITEQERAQYRQLAYNSDNRFIALVNAFKADRNTEQLVKGLQFISGGTPQYTQQSLARQPSAVSQINPVEYGQPISPIPPVHQPQLPNLFSQKPDQAQQEQKQGLDKNDGINYLAKIFAQNIAGKQAYSNIMPFTLAQAAGNKLYQSPEELKHEHEIHNWATQNGVFELPDNPDTKLLKSLKTMQEGTQKAKSVKSANSRTSKKSKSSQDKKNFSQDDMFKIRDIVGLGQINAKQLVGYMRKYLQANIEIDTEQFIEIMSKIGSKVTGWAKMRKNDALTKLFKIIDVNDDGVIDRGELSNSLILLAGGKSEDKIEAMFMLYDINGDGLISFDELYQHQLCIYEIMFKTNPEIRRKVGESARNMARITAESIFQQIDANNDKVITLEEFQAWYGREEVSQDNQKVKLEKLKSYYKKRSTIELLLQNLKNQILNNKELEEMIFLASECGFVGIHVFDAFKVFMDENNSGFINRQHFQKILADLIQRYSENPHTDIAAFNDFSSHLFAAFDIENKGVINMDELFCGLSISCRGNLAEKMHAIFRCFEKSGDKRLDFEELMHFFMGIFTILMQGIVLPQGVTKEILSHTLIKEIFNKFDLDIDEEGVSYEQMMKWIAVVSN